jgi:hypothetical protein
MELLRYLLIVQMDVVMLVVCGDTEKKASSCDRKYLWLWILHHISQVWPLPRLINYYQYIPDVVYNNNHTDIVVITTFNIIN